MYVHGFTPVARLRFPTLSVFNNRIVRGGIVLRFNRNGVGGLNVRLVRVAHGHVENQKGNEYKQKQQIKAELVKHDAISKWCKSGGKV